MWCVDELTTTFRFLQADSDIDLPQEQLVLC